ncbi:MAG: peptidoglycan DD-metalloendopeptidase family protein [Solirubrobacterales bacterium]
MAAALLASPPALAAAMTTGGAPTPVGGAPAPPSATGTPATGTPSAGTLSLFSASTFPRKSFYFGLRNPSLRFEIESSQPQNDLRIDVVDEQGEVVRSYYRNDVAPHTAVAIRWDGLTSEKRPAPNGRYSFQVTAQGAASRVAHRTASSGGPLSLSFAFYGYEFPILGPHNYGGPENRFGAPRAGHTHQGQDVLANCGLALVAARGGKVQYAGYEAAAGNYIVIDGKGTGYDMVYMHLAEPSPLRTGDTVRTGEPIGIVGDTGDATGCHLHFEIWTPPGWYQGGSPIDPLPLLKKWDSYS